MESNIARYKLCLLKRRERNLNNLLKIPSPLKFLAEFLIIQMPFLWQVLILPESCDILDTVKETTVFLVRLRRKYDIAFFNFTLESYEGLGISTVLDPEKGLLKLEVPKGLEEEAVDFLEGLKGELDLEWSKLEDR